MPGTERRIRESRRRLAVALWFSTVLFVATVVLLPLDLPDVERPSGLVELEVSIAQDIEPTDAAEPEQEQSDESPPVEELLTESETDTDVVAEEQPTLVEEESPEPAVDRYAEMREVVRSMGGGLDVPSMSPGLDEKRRLARLQFRASKAVRPKPIWENVEKDMMGRTILRAGDCYRVLGDPNVGTQDVFRTFGQYLVYCENIPDAPAKLAFVDDIVERYAYLQGPRDADAHAGVRVPGIGTEIAEPFK